MNSHDSKGKIPPRASLEQRILARASDPDTLSLLESFRELAHSDLGRQFFLLVGQEPDKVDEILSSQDRLASVVGGATLTLAEHGWAPSGRMPVDVYIDALAAMQQHGLEVAERILVDGWERQISVLGWLPSHLSGFGSDDPMYQALFQRRARLVRKALDHHVSGAYEASVPMLLTNIEGITTDVAAGRLFFSKQPQLMADVVDDATIAGLNEALPVVRAWFSLAAPNTVVSGTLSRHGVLHGRVLAYDTKLNSTKCVVLLAAVMEWAEPLARAEGLRRRLDREEQNAGSTEKDENGRRVDDREFKETQDALRYLRSCQIGWHKNLGHFRRDLLDVVQWSFERYGWQEDHGVNLEVSADGQSWWAWRRTPSGQVLGIGAVNDPHTPWFFDATTPPSGPPQPSPGWGSGPLCQSPNWS
jgi:hypothetical protein